MKAATTKLENAKLKELRLFVQMCFVLIEKESFAEIAAVSGLSLATIYRLAKGDFSLRCQTRTIVMFAYAAGVKYEWRENEIVVSLIQPLIKAKSGKPVKA